MNYGHRAEGCEPCGECRACKTEGRQLAELKRLRAEMKKALKLLLSTTQAVEEEVDNEWGEPGQDRSPTLVDFERRAKRARKFLGEHGVGRTAR